MGEPWPSGGAHGDKISPCIMRSRMYIVAGIGIYFFGVSGAQVRVTLQSGYAGWAKISRIRWKLQFNDCLVEDGPRSGSCVCLFDDNSNGSPPSPRVVHLPQSRCIPSCSVHRTLVARRIGHAEAQFRITSMLSYIRLSLILDMHAPDTRPQLKARATLGVKFSPSFSFVPNSLPVCAASGVWSLGL